MGLFAHDNARRSGHHFPIVVTGEGRELLWFHERGFLAGIDSCPFNWRQRGIRNGIDIEASCNDDGLGFSRFSDVRHRQRPVLISVGPRRIARVYTAATLVGAAPTEFIILAAGLVAINVIVVARGNGSREGVLSQTGLNKTTQRNPRQRGS